MTEIYLRGLERFLTPILLVLTLFMLYRGHDLPGGGFIAGLIAAAAFELRILSRGPERVRKELGKFLQPGIGIGLLLAICTAIGGIFAGGFFQGIWVEFDIGNAHLKFGTPQLFDVGVFLTVASVATSYLLGMSEAAYDTGE